jgi:phytoene dehydrogenase-like protein
VSSAGLQPTVLKLVGDEHFDAGYTTYVRGLQPGWGFTSGRYFLKKDVLKLPMYVVYSDDSWWDTERYEAVRSGKEPDEVILFMVVPSNYDPEMSPPGKQVLVAGTICPPDPEWREIEMLYRKMDEMLARLYPEAWAAVERRDYDGPKEIASATRDSVVPGAGGECVGLASMVGQCGRHKPSVESPIPGLYFAGADAGSAGMGTHMAADSGMMVARMILARHRAAQGG